MAAADNARKLFGRRVRQLRKFRGWTQEELAVKAHMDAKSMGAIERGERNITLDNVSKIARGLGVELLQLFLFDARGVKVEEEVAEERILDALRTSPPKRKLMILGVLSEILRHVDGSV
jgi:transcriptional regulator with XRE-family HTH domain